LKFKKNQLIKRLKDQKIQIITSDLWLPSWKFIWKICFSKTCEKLDPGSLFYNNFPPEKVQLRWRTIRKWQFTKFDVKCQCRESPFRLTTNDPDRQFDGNFRPSFCAESLCVGGDKQILILLGGWQKYLKKTGFYNKSSYERSS